MLECIINYFSIWYRLTFNFDDKLNQLNLSKFVKVSGEKGQVGETEGPLPAIGLI